MLKPTLGTRKGRSWRGQTTRSPRHPKLTKTRWRRQHERDGGEAETVCTPATAEAGNLASACPATPEAPVDWLGQLSVPSGSSLKSQCDSKWFTASTLVPDPDLAHRLGVGWPDIRDKTDKTLSSSWSAPLRVDRIKPGF